MPMTVQCPVVDLTPPAIRQVKRLIDKRGSNLGLRLGVKGGGCSGFSYAMALEPLPGDGDIAYEVDGIRIFVDKKSAGFLRGATLDWSMANLLDGGFKFINPNATRTCGCGTSFQPKL